MTKKFSPWFPPEIKPVRVGVYQVNDADYQNGVAWSYWNGERFCYRTWTETVAYTTYTSENPTALPAFTYWRGLARKP